MRKSFAKPNKPTFLIRKVLSLSSPNGLTTDQIFEYVKSNKEDTQPEHVRGRISEMQKRGLIQVLFRRQSQRVLKLTEHGMKVSLLEQNHVDRYAR